MVKMCLFEVRAPARIPFRERISGYAHGFRSESVLMYRIPRPWTDGYLSDMAFARSTTINGRHRLLLDDRLAFDELMWRVTKRIPECYGHTEGGTFVPADGSASRGLAPAIDDLLERHGRLVGKPVRGTTQGKDVCVLERGREREELLCNGHAISDADLYTALRNHVVTEFVRQAEYARVIHPPSTNTVRVLTMVDPDTNNAFPATALHRFGTSLSGPIDNLHAGGLSAGVDLDTGELGPAVLFPVKGRKRMEVVETHPDSGMPITGVLIPGWFEILDELLAIATAVGDRIPYVGWDVVISDDGFTIIEGNGRTGFGVQIHGRVFDRPEILRFFAHHRVVRARREWAEPRSSTA